jgi:hypothetical protein
MGGCLKTLGVLLLLAVVVIVIASMTGPSQSDKERSLVIAKVALANLTYRPEWASVSIDTAEPTSYDFTLWYRDDAVVHLGQAEADTEVIVRSMLSYLITNGQQPSNEKIYVSAFAAKHARGATGKPLAAMFGYAYYDYGNDLIRYVPCTGKRGWASC